MAWPSPTPPFGQDLYPNPNPNLYPLGSNRDHHQGPLPPAYPPWALHTHQHHGASDVGTTYPYEAPVYSLDQHYPPELRPHQELGIHHEFQTRSSGFDRKPWDPQHKSNDFGGANPSQPNIPYLPSYPPSSSSDNFSSPHGFPGFSNPSSPPPRPSPLDCPPVYPSASNGAPPWCPPETMPGLHIPSSQGHIPSGQGHLPSGQGHIPSNQGHIPSGQGHLPSGQGHIPSDQGHIPSGQGHLPSGQGHIPSSQGHIPSGQGHLPSGQGHTPSDQGHIPSSQGHIPSSQGHIPSQPNFLDGDPGISFGYKPPSVHPLLQSVTDDFVPHEEENESDNDAEEEAKRGEDEKFNYSHPALEKFGMNVTTRAKQGSLGPVHGRDLVVRQCIEILTRKSKCNPVLVGHPGVGKTAIVEGLAQRIVKGGVPEPLRKCKIIAVDFQTVLAGTVYRGEFESKMKELIDEATMAKRKVILFFDELHRMIGAGKIEGSADSASESLKPALARGDFLCIGATTFDEYTKYIEKDQALSRRFQKVVVDPPSVEDTVSILRGLKPSLESHHGISIADDALIQAVKLSERYIPDRFLPDKAIDLVDVSASKLKIGLLTKPPILDEIDRAILELDMERLGITPATSQASQERLQRIHSDLEGLKARQANLNRKWKKEKTLATRVVSLKEKIKALKNPAGSKPAASNVSGVGRTKPNRNKFSHDPINEVHSYITCDSCYKNPITGPRYTHQTQDIDLCGVCHKALLNGNSGAFRMHPPSAFHLVKPPRLTCNGCSIRPILGDYYLNIQFTDNVLCEPCFRRENRSLPNDSYLQMHNNLKESKPGKSNYDAANSSNLRELEAQLAIAEQEWKDYERSHKPFIQVEVSSTTIAEVLSAKTGIPVSKLQASQMEQLLQLHAELHKRVIGQDEACNAIARAIQRSRAGLSDPKRPIASLMFMGPTGVGKTELAKALAVQLFNSEDAMVRIDMSEYGEKFNISRLTGAAPGLLGHGDGGQLTTPVRRKPYTVVLFDEIEKADDDIFNIFLQILDDGRLTDSEGRVVNFTNTVIIMTSNVGADAITGVAENSQAGAYDSTDEAYQEMKSRVMDAVRDKYRPEFVNRIDEFIIFQPLNPQQICEIVKLQLERVSQRLQDRQIKFRVSESALQLLSAMGYDPRYGARPVKRAVQQSIEDPLAQGILRGHYPEGCTIMIDTEFSPSHMEQQLSQQKLIFYKMP